MICDRINNHLTSYDEKTRGMLKAIARIVGNETLQKHLAQKLIDLPKKSAQEVTF